MTNDSNHAFIGTSTDTDEDGVFGVRGDAAGTLDQVSATNAGTEPMFLAPNSTGDRLYVAIRPDAGGRVVAYDIDRETYTLSRLNDAPTRGNGTPCYLSVDATDQCVLTAQYDGGTVSALPIDGDGRVGEPTAVVEHEGSGPDPDRQSEPHPHAIRPGPDNEYAYAPDLGTDRVCIYDFDAEAGTLDPAACGHVDVHDGAGPRHLDCHPNGRFVYLIDELDSTVVAYERDADTGALAPLETVSTLPEDFEGENYPADVHVHPSGEFLYGSNRGHDSIAVFELDSEGRPSLLDTESTRGEWPRHFALSPTGEFLFAENADADTIVTFRIEDDGTLDPTGSVLDVPSPVCMQFIDE